MHSVMFSPSLYAPLPYHQSLSSTPSISPSFIPFADKRIVHRLHRAGESVYCDFVTAEEEKRQACCCSGDSCIDPFTLSFSISARFQIRNTNEEIKLIILKEKKKDRHHRDLNLRPFLQNKMQKIMGQTNLPPRLMERGERGEGRGGERGINDRIHAK